jgi:uncharacterized protein (UPF0335 family)
MEERKGLNEDIRDVVAEAKTMGFDGAALRRLVSLHRMEKQKRDERIAIDETYMAAVGLI